MAIKQILVPLDGGESGLQVLETALVVARRFGAHIDALHVMQRPEDSAPFMLDRLSAGLRETIGRETERVEREGAATVREAFEAFCAEHSNTHTRFVYMNSTPEEIFLLACDYDVGRGGVAQDLAEAARLYRKKEPEELRWGHRIEEPGVMDLVTVDEVIEKLEASRTPLA